MSNIRDPITVNTTVKSVRFDDAGECILTMRIPASDAAAAARFAIMQGIVFETRFTPVDANSTQETV